MTTERIDIVVREDGSRVVKRNLEDIGESADKAAGFIKTMGGLLAAIGAAGVVGGMLRLADTFTTIQNKLRLVTTGTENLARVTKELQGIANATRTDFESTSELYSRVASATKELGLSQKQLLGFTKSLNQAVVLSGATASEAAGGLRQLAQGLASGALRGDELNSVMENFPKVADVIAEGMGKTRGELRAMGAEGKITAKDIIDAFAKAGESLEKDFASTVPTVSQSFTVLKNNLMGYIGEMDAALGVTSKLAGLIMLVGNNINIILPILAGLGVAIATAFAPTVIAMFTAQLQGLWALILANPFTALAAAVLALLTVLYTMRDEIKLGIDDTTTLGDLMRAAWESVGPAIAAVADVVKSVWGFITDTVATALNNVTDNTEKSTGDQEATWLKLVRVVVQVFDMIGGTVRGVMRGIFNVVSSVVAALMNNFAQLGKAIQGALNMDGDAVMAAVKSNLDGWKDAGASIGENFNAGFQQEVLSQSDSGLESILNGWIARAKEIGKERLKGVAGGELGGGGANTTKPPIDPDAAKKAKDAARELERLKDALQGVMDEADPVGAATRRLAEAHDILTRSVKAGLLEQSKADQIYASLEERMAAQLRPLEALNKEIDRNIELLKMSSGQRQIEADMYQLTEQLKRDGVILTEKETAALRSKLTVEQELARIAQARDSLEQNSGAGQFAEFMTNLQAMKDALNDMQSQFGAGDVAGALGNMMPWANLEGTQEQMNAYVQLHADMYAQIDALRSENLINEQTAGMLRNQADLQLLTARLENTRKFFGTLAQLSSSENKKLAQIGKAAAIVQATIDGVLAVQKTMAETPYPYNIPLAAAQAAVAAANVAQIASTGFRTGGSMTVGGSGGPDSQLVAFRATPGEKVQVNTPSQARAAEEGGGASPQVNVPVTIVNVDDPQRYVDAMDTGAGKSVIMNHMQSDPAAFKRALGMS